MTLEGLIDRGAWPAAGGSFVDDDLVQVLDAAFGEGVAPCSPAP